MLEVETLGSSDTPSSRLAIGADVPVWTIHVHAASRSDLHAVKTTTYLQPDNICSNDECQPFQKTLHNKCIKERIIAMRKNWDLFCIVIGSYSSLVMVVAKTSLSDVNGLNHIHSFISIYV